MKTFVVVMMCCVIIQMLVAEKSMLHVGALFELSNHWFARYITFFIEVIEHVFEEIENRTDILADYSLKLISKDTEVS